MFQSPTFAAPRFLQKLEICQTFVPSTFNILSRYLKEIIFTCQSNACYAKLVKIPVTCTVSSHDTHMAVSGAQSLWKHNQVTLKNFFFVRQESNADSKGKEV